MTYNLSLINASGMAPLMQTTSDVILGGMLGLLILIMVGGILFINFYRFTRRADKSIVGTTFICFMLSILLFFLGLVKDLVIYIMLVATAVALIFIWNKE